MSADDKAGTAPRTALRIGVIVLAAGGSTRLGQPKQLLRIEGVPLIVRVVAAALDSPLWPVVVVVGSAAVAIRKELARHPVLIAENPVWMEGMASSLRTGIATLASFSRTLDGALVALCDQSAFSRHTIECLLQKAPPHLDGHIVASRYADRLGAPALFSRTYFPALANLSGDEGARHVISAASQAGMVTTVDLPELADDIDTPQDLARFGRP